MKTRHHLLLAVLCILLWAGFYILGIQYNYFQIFSNESMFMLVLTTFVCILPLVAIIVLALINVPFLRASIWLAFYGSVIPFILDYIFVGIIKGEGPHFLVSHWYLTLGYFAVWIIFPLIAKSLERLSLKIVEQNF